jgi:hypothetical protein
MACRWCCAPGDTKADRLSGTAPCAATAVMYDGLARYRLHKVFTKLGIGSRLELDRSLPADQNQRVSVYRATARRRSRHQRPSGGRLRQQAEPGQADEEAARNGAFAQAERNPARLGLRVEQPRQADVQFARTGKTGPRTGSRS